MRVLALLALAGCQAVSGGAGSGESTRIDLRLRNALVGGKAAEWEREARVTLHPDHPGRARIGPKEGWTIAGWHGRVVSSSLTIRDGAVTGALKAEIAGTRVDPGRYSFSIDGRVVDGAITGSFTTRRDGTKAGKGSLRGSVARVDVAPLDRNDAVLTLTLVRALPRNEPMGVHLTRKKGGFAPGFAFAPTFTRRPLEVDASKLMLEGDRLRGALRVTRVRRGERDGGARNTFGEFEVDARVAGSAVLGTFTGSNIGGEKVSGRAWGRLMPRDPVPDPARVFIKLENGLSGGADWQNRVFFTFTAAGGRAAEGRVSNNKGVYTARFDGADLEWGGGRFGGTLRTTVLEGSVDHGAYACDLRGWMAGRVVCGRFTTRLEDREVRQGYFVGDLGPAP